MPKVKLTRSDWNWVCILLENNLGYVSDPILKEINKQLDRQEH